MQVHTVNSNSWTSNCQRGLFSKKNAIIQIFCISGRLAIPINPDKWSYTVFLILMASEPQSRESYHQNNKHRNPVAASGSPLVLSRIWSVSIAYYTSYECICPRNFHSLEILIHQSNCIPNPVLLDLTYFSGFQELLQMYCYRDRAVQGAEGSPCSPAMNEAVTKQLRCNWCTVT